MKENKKPLCWLIGATHGIGSALINELTNTYKIVASGRTRGVLKEQDLYVSLDVTNQKSVEKAYKEIRKNHGVPELIIYLAGTYDPSSYKYANLDRALQTIDVNLSGVFRMLDVIKPDVFSGRIAHVALVASVAGYFGLPNSYAYGASKAALINLAETLKAELSNLVKIQVICPGFVKTRLTNKNNFKMPDIITPERAAKEIALGLRKNVFEIHFPKSFSRKLKFLKLLPYFLFFKITSRLKSPNSKK